MRKRYGKEEASVKIIEFLKKFQSFMALYVTDQLQHTCVLVVVELAVSSSSSSSVVVEYSPSLLKK